VQDSLTHPPGREAVRSHLWTAVETAEFLRVPLATVYRWAQRGEGPQAYKVGKYLRYRVDEVQTWVHQQTAGKPRGQRF